MCLHLAAGGSSVVTQILSPVRLVARNPPRAGRIRFNLLREECIVAAKIMRKVLASIALVSVLSAQIITANALPLSDDLTSETVNRTVAMLDEEGAKKPIGENAQATFGGLSIGKQDLAQVDLTGGQYVEFQFYVSDYEALKAAMEAAGDKVDTLQLILARRQRRQRVGDL